MAVGAAISAAGMALVLLGCFVACSWRLDRRVSEAKASAYKNGMVTAAWVAKRVPDGARAARAIEDYALSRSNADSGLYVAKELEEVKK